MKGTDKDEHSEKSTNHAAEQPRLKKKIHTTVTSHSEMKEPGFCATTLPYTLISLMMPF